VAQSSTSRRRLEVARFSVDRASMRSIVRRGCTTFWRPPQPPPASQPQYSLRDADNVARGASQTSYLQPLVTLPFKDGSYQCELNFRGSWLLTWWPVTWLLFAGYAAFRDYALDLGQQHSRTRGTSIGLSRASVRTPRWACCPDARSCTPACARRFLSVVDKGRQENEISDRGTESLLPNRS